MTVDQCLRLQLVQEQLVMLLHAHRCWLIGGKRTMGSKRTTMGRCRQPHCVTLRKLWVHINVCQDGLMCSELNCAASQRILKHWSRCYKARDDCPLCAPLKHSECEELQDNLYYCISQLKMD